MYVARRLLTLQIVNLPTRLLKLQTWPRSSYVSFARQICRFSNIGCQLSSRGQGVRLMVIWTSDFSLLSISPTESERPLSELLAEPDKLLPNDTDNIKNKQSSLPTILTSAVYTPSGFNLNQLQSSGTKVGSRIKTLCKEAMRCPVSLCILIHNLAGMDFVTQPATFANSVAR